MPRSRRGDRRADGAEGARPRRRDGDRVANLDAGHLLRPSRRTALRSERAPRADEGAALQRGQAARHQRPLEDEQAAAGGSDQPEEELGARARRKRYYRSLSSLQRDNAVCRACAEAGFPLESTPVFEGKPGQRAMIVGQAPGVVEGEERRPWRGRAGQTLRRWLELDEHDFYETFYCVSVTRCYPGKHLSGRGDRPATPEEISLCRFWLDWELRLLRPAVIVPVGGLATKRLLGIARLDDCIGSRFEPGEAAPPPPPPPPRARGGVELA